MTVPVTLKLAELAVGLSLEDLQPEVRLVARQAVLDWIGVSIAGVSQAPVTAMAAVLLAQGGEPTATALLQGQRLPSINAALFNGMASHALDYDDVNFAVPGHASAPVLAAALAVAEELKASGRDFLEAFVAGYEVGCRVGLLLAPNHYSLGFHATSTAGTFGATAAAGKLLGLNARQMARAFGIAATRASGIKAVFGTSGKPLQAGNAASNGVLSALLARAGLDAIEDALEHKIGFAATHGKALNVEAALGNARLVGDFSFVPSEPEDGPARHHIEFNLFKYHATCYETHSAIECALALRTHLGGKVEQIRSIEMLVNSHCDDICNIQIPQTGFEGKFSLRLATAFGLLGLPTGDPALFSDANVNSPRAVEMRDRVTISLRDDVRVPVTKLRVELSDGSTWSTESDSSVPMQDLQQQQSKLESKFLVLTSEHVGQAESKQAIRAVASLEKIQDIRTFTATFGASA